MTASPLICRDVNVPKAPARDNPLWPTRRAHQERGRCRADAIGLTVLDAFGLVRVRIAKEKALPFDPLVPNVETTEAMRAARREELTTVGPPAWLLGFECGMLDTWPLRALLPPRKSGRHDRRLDAALLQAVTMLAMDDPLPRHYFDHQLSGELTDHRDWPRSALILILPQTGWFEP